MMDVIAELYKGGLDPSEWPYQGSPAVQILTEGYEKNRAWLAEHLTGEAKERFLELAHCHRELLDTLSLEHFRGGFTVGVSLLIQAIPGGDGGHRPGSI